MKNKIKSEVPAAERHGSEPPGARKLVHVYMFIYILIHVFIFIYIYIYLYISTYLCSYLYAQNIAIQHATEAIQSLKEAVNKNAIMSRIEWVFVNEYFIYILFELVCM